MGEIGDGRVLERVGGFDGYVKAGVVEGAVHPLRLTLRATGALRGY
jgi:hypothetical protein